MRYVPAGGRGIGLGVDGHLHLSNSGIVGDEFHCHGYPLPEAVGLLATTRPTAEARVMNPAASHNILVSWPLQ